VHENFKGGDGRVCDRRRFTRSLTCASVGMLEGKKPFVSRDENARQFELGRGGEGAESGFRGVATPQNKGGSKFLGLLHSEHYFWLIMCNERVNTIEYRTTQKVVKKVLVRGRDLIECYRSRFPSLKFKGQ